MIDDWRTSIRGRWLMIALLLAWGATAAALAQGPTAQTSPGAKASPAPRQQSPAPAGTPGAPKPAAQPAPPITQAQALYLTRATLLTLNDANRCGNYTVLRDLAAPDFQAKNTAADLALVFTDLRRRNIDLFAVALLNPQFTPAPALDASGRVRLTGFFPTRPLQINFDLTFQVVGGQWRLFAISVATPEVAPTQSQINSPPKQRSPGPFYGVRVLSGTLGWRW